MNKDIFFNNKYVILFLFLVVCFTWGTTWIGIKIAVETVNPLLAAGLRFVIAFPFLVLITIIAKSPILFPRKSFHFFLLLTLFYFTIPYYLISFGEQYVSSGLTSLLFSTMPIFSIIFAKIILKDKIYINQVIGITVGFLCLMYILISEGFILSYSDFWGVISILLAALMHGFLYVYSKKAGEGINVFTFNTLPIGVAGIALCLLSFTFEENNFQNISLNSWLALIYLGIFASVFGFIAYFFLLKRMSPVVLSFIFIIFPVVAIFISSIYEHKIISTNFIICTIIMLCGFAITKLPVNVFKKWIKSDRNRDNQ